MNKGWIEMDACAYQVCVCGKDGRCEEAHGSDKRKEGGMQTTAVFRFIHQYYTGRKQMATYLLK